MQKRIIIWAASTPGSIGKTNILNKPLLKKIYEEIKRQQKIEKSYTKLQAELSPKQQPTKKKLNKL